jgi:DNA mismatch endonuclease (patch repair protein)
MAPGGEVGLQRAEVSAAVWHGHHCARGDRQPKANAEYWSTKISRNKERDVAHLTALRADGWNVLTVWECEINNVNLLPRLKRFLGR